jgi:hypothetical protein
MTDAGILSTPNNMAPDLACWRLSQAVYEVPVINIVRALSDTTCVDVTWSTSKYAAPMLTYFR